MSIAKWATNRLQVLLNKLDVGYMPGVIYDTAIIGSLKDKHNISRFKNQTKKVIQSQQIDGHWGSNFSHPYDHLLNTVAALSMMVDLKLDTKLDKEFSKGILWLYENQKEYFKTDYPIPVGFEFIYPKLVNNIMSKSIAENISISSLEKARQQKLEKLNDYVFNTVNPLFFSMEGVVTNNVEANQISSFQGKKGDLFASPASTSIFIKHNIKSAIPGAMKYINTMTNKNHLIQHFGDYKNFNIVYSLYPILKTNYRFGTEIVRLLGDINKNWQKRGLSFGNSFPIPDLDCSSFGLIVLSYFGYGEYNEKKKCFSYYKGKKAFNTYPFENVPALISNVHALEGITKLDHSNTEYIDIIVNYLGNIGDNLLTNSKYLASKIMHYSSIILSLIPALSDMAYFYIEKLETFIKNNLTKEILYIEEKGHSLLALLHAKNHGFEIDENILHLLFMHIYYGLDQYGNYEPTFLWSSKVQYSPIEIDKAYIYSAILKYTEIFGDEKMELRPNMKN